MDVETATVEDDVERKRHKKNPWDSRYVAFCLSGWEPRGAVHAGTQQAATRHQKELQLQPTNRRTADATRQQVHDVGSYEDGHDDGNESLAVMIQAHVAASASVQIHARLELIKSMKQALVKQITEAVRHIGKEHKQAPQSTGTGAAAVALAGPGQKGFGSRGSDASCGGSRNEAGGKEIAELDPPDPRLEPRLSACLAVLRGEASLWPGQLVAAAQRQLESVAAAATTATAGRSPSELVSHSSALCLEWDWNGDVHSVASLDVPAPAAEQAGACHYLAQLLARVPPDNFAGQDLMQCDDGEVTDYQQQRYHHHYHLPRRRHAEGVGKEEDEYGATEQGKGGHKFEARVRQGRNWSGGERVDELSGRDNTRLELREAMTDVHLPYYLMGPTRPRALRKMPQSPPSPPTGPRISLPKQQRQPPQQHQNRQEQQPPQPPQQEQKRQPQQQQKEAPEVLQQQQSPSCCSPPSCHHLAAAPPGPVPDGPCASVGAATEAATTTSAGPSPWTLQSPPRTIERDPAGQLQPAVPPAWGLSDHSNVAVMGLTRLACATSARVSGAWKHCIDHVGAGFDSLRGDKEMGESDAEDIEVVVCMEGDEVLARVGTKDDDCGKARVTPRIEDDIGCGNYNGAASLFRSDLKAVAVLPDGDNDTATRDVGDRKDNGQCVSGATAALAANSGGDGNGDGPVVSANEAGGGGDGDPLDVVDLVITGIEVRGQADCDVPFWRSDGEETPLGCQVAQVAMQTATGATQVEQVADGSANTASASARVGVEEAATGSCWKQPKKQPQPQEVVGRKEDHIIVEGHAGICDGGGVAASSAVSHLGHVAKATTTHRMVPSDPRAAPRALANVVSRPRVVPLLAQRRAKYRLAARHSIAEAPPKPPAATSRENGDDDEPQPMRTEPEDAPDDIPVAMAAPHTAVIAPEIQRRPVILTIGRRRCGGGNVEFPPGARAVRITAVEREGRNGGHGALGDAGADKHGTDDAIESDDGELDAGRTVANKSALGELQLRTGTVDNRAVDTSCMAVAASQGAAVGASLLPSRGNVPQVLSGRRHTRGAPPGSVSGSSVPTSVRTAVGASDRANRQQPQPAGDGGSLVDTKKTSDNVHPGRPGHGEAAATAAGGSPLRKGATDDDGNDAVEILDTPSTSTSNPGKSFGAGDLCGGSAVGEIEQGRLRRPVIGRRNAAARCDGDAIGDGEDGHGASPTTTQPPSDFVCSHGRDADNLLVMGTDGPAGGDSGDGDGGQAGDDHVDEDEDWDGANAKTKNLPPAGAAPDIAVGPTTAAADVTSAMTRALPKLVHRKLIRGDGGGGHVRSSGGEGGEPSPLAVTAASVEPVRQPKYTIRASPAFGMSEAQLKEMAPAAVLQSSGWNAKIRCRPVHNPEMLLLPHQLPSSSGGQSLRELLAAGSSDPRVTGVLSAARRLLGALLPTEQINALPPWPPPPPPPPLPTQQTIPQHQMPGTAVPPAQMRAPPAATSAGGVWDDDDDDITYDDAFFQELDRVVEAATNAGVAGPGGDMAPAPVAGVATAPTGVSASDGLPPSAAGGAVPPGANLAAPCGPTAAGLHHSRPALASRFVPLFNTPLEDNHEDVREVAGREGIRGNENRANAGGIATTGAMAATTLCSYRTAAELLETKVQTHHGTGMAAAYRGGVYGASMMAAASIPHPPVTVAHLSIPATISGYTSHNCDPTITYGNGSPTGSPAEAMPGGGAVHSVPDHVQIRKPDYHREEEGENEGKEEEDDDGADVAVTICDVDDRAPMMATPMCGDGVARSASCGNNYQSHLRPPSTSAAVSGQMQLTTPRERQRTHSWTMANTGAYGTAQPYWQAATPAPHHSSSFHWRVVGTRDSALQECAGGTRLPVSSNRASPRGIGTSRLAARAAAGNSNGCGGNAGSDVERGVENVKALGGPEGACPGTGLQIQSSAAAGQLMKPQFVDGLGVSAAPLVVAAAGPIAAATACQETGIAAGIMAETSADLANDLEAGAALIIYADDGVEYHDALGNGNQDIGGGDRVQLSNGIPFLGAVGVRASGRCDLGRRHSGGAGGDAADVARSMSDDVITIDSKAEDADCDVVVVLPPGSPGPGGCSGMQDDYFGAFAWKDNDFDFDFSGALSPQHAATSAGLGVIGKLDGSDHHDRDGVMVEHRNTVPESRNTCGKYDDDWVDDDESCSLVFDSELCDENVLLLDELAALPGAEVNQICNAAQAAVNEAVERGTVSMAEGAEAVAALEVAAAAAATAVEELESGQPELKQRLRHVVKTAATATAAGAMLSNLPAIAGGAKRKREQLWAVYIRELLAARQRSRLNLRTLMTFLADKLCAAKAAAGSDTGAATAIGAGATPYPAIRGATMDPAVGSGPTSCGVGNEGGYELPARACAACGPDDDAVVAPAGKLHSLLLSLGQLTAEAAEAPGLGCSARMGGQEYEGLAQRGAVSQHRVFLALLNMAHQNNVAWQRQQEEKMSAAAGKMPQRPALRGGGGAMALGQQWMEGMMRLQSGHGSNVRVEVLPV